MAYLIKLSMTYKEAYDMVRKVRIFINPRPGQVKRLKELEVYYRERHKPSLNQPR
jgi:dual specificity MAP kinase phosphatase